jgi:hypothetical protein
MKDIAFVVHPTWLGRLLYSDEEDRWFFLPEFDDDTATPMPFDLRPCSKAQARRLLLFADRQDLIEQYREALAPRRAARAW